MYASSETFTSRRLVRHSIIGASEPPPLRFDICGYEDSYPSPITPIGILSEIGRHAFEWEWLQHDFPVLYSAPPAYNSTGPAKPGHSLDHDRGNDRPIRRIHPTSPFLSKIFLSLLGPNPLCFVLPFFP